ncbi:hypothetical protein COLU111180_05140 [Cohnella lubricantis]|uniref:Uncharacterized protein n=1 Tax=Cohnella lubricantis TaxID=2163172 RepID=A0A841TD42_9BACL|nr:hypothetical protein [Cohnella lubricantis]MBB6677268.1 hypothetical protein [Cohnella lubricantis]MBP2116921.1 hypothetical protein [Cohnella lubricantis]
MNNKAGKAKVIKKKGSGDVQPQMKIVLSDVCAVCPTPCTRGLQYLARMSEPGASGNGVPCVLTLPRSAVKAVV